MHLQYALPMKWILRVGLVLVLLVAALLFFARGVVEDRVIATLKARGVAIESLRVDSVGLGSVTFSQLRLGEKQAFTANTLTLRYLGGLSRETLTLGVRAQGLAVTLRQRPGGWAMGGVEALWLGAPLKGKTTARLFLAGDMKVAGKTTTLHEATIALDRVSIEQGKVTVKVTDIQAHLEKQATAMQMPFRIASVQMLQQDAPATLPLAVKGDATLADGAPTIEVVATAQDAAAQLIFNLTLSHERARGEGRITIASQPISLGEEALRLDVVAPLLAAGLQTPTMQATLLPTTLHYTASGLQRATGELAVYRMPLGSLLAQALGGHAEMQGTVSGTLPIRFQRGDWRLKDAAFHNEGPMVLRMAAQGANAEVNPLTTALGTQSSALDKVDVSVLTLAATSTDDAGNIRVKGTLKGFNPLLGREVVLNITVQTNLRDMMRSMAAAQLKDVAL